MSRDSLGYVIDDSALFHRAPYDPAKARAYYLANRKLKGRKKGSQSLSGPSAPANRSNQSLVGGPGGEANRSKTKSRQAELRAQRERLEKRLDRLREVLDGIMEKAKNDAKKRSGGDPNKGKNEKDKAPETQADKADRNKDQKKDKPETASEKKEKAKKAKEAYEKEHPNSLSSDVEVLQEQVADIQGRIKDALAAAAERRKKAGEKNEGSGSRDKKLSGPQGR